MSSCIFPEDERSETECKAIIDTLKEKAALLDKWREHHESKHGEGSHDIPPSSEVTVTKMEEGSGVMTDNCNGARLENKLIAVHIEKVCKEKAVKEGRDPEDITVFQSACHHHLRNVWFGAVTKRLSGYLNELLQADLECIDRRYRVSTKMDSLLRAVDKEFSLPANYPKG